MTKAITQTYTVVHDYRRQITQALLLTCMVMALAYAINLYRVISHSLALQSITREQASLDSSIQALDSQYTSLSNKITPDMLHTYGFDQGKVSAFISRTASLGSVSMVGHEL